MAYTNDALNAAVNGIAAAGSWISFHTADPGTTGASEIAGAREQTTWGAAAAGERDGSEVSASISGGTTVTHWGIWSASAAGTFLFGGALTTPEAFGSDGTLLHTPTIRVQN